MQREARQTNIQEMQIYIEALEKENVILKERVAAVAQAQGFRVGRKDSAKVRVTKVYRSDGTTDI